MKIFRYIFLVALVTMAGLSVMSGAQGQNGNGSRNKEEKDSLVYLLSSKSAQTVVINNVNYRKVIGPARFLHNDTYLLCDTALWNVDTKVIDAWGNVSILQDETVLTSEKLKYLIDQDLAQFRGAVVQLTDKDHNTLRTRYLDYNTADSVAVFHNGGSMRDKDGQIIESREGTYDSKIKTFTFDKDVNMFSDSVFIKTRSLVYESDKDFATFNHATDVWKDENMLSAHEGWYDRANEIFFFRRNVHVMSEDQEGWCDSMFFYRNTSNVDMLGNAQVTDTTRNVFGLAGRIEYVDSISKVTMTRKPAVISEAQNKDGSLDTVYLGAERLVYYTLQKCDIDSLMVLDAEKRIAAMKVDPVGEYRRKAAEEAAKAAEEAAKNDPNYRPKPVPSPKAGPKVAEKMPPVESVAQMDSSPELLSDSLAVSDTLAPVQDTLVVEPPKDTTKIGFLEAQRNVKIFKKDMQIVCDSLLYSDLDSLGRLFKEPIIWQEERKQYRADSVYLVIRNSAVDKASLMSEAFISIQEDSTHFDQIKGTEMLAYFNQDGDLSRFDVLGGASALFYIEENETLATVNKPESKMLSALLKDGEVQKIYYYDQAKNDGYPIVQLEKEEQTLKGFNWQPEKRPPDRYAVTPLSLRPSERLRFEARPKARYIQTDIYFPGYMSNVYEQIAVRDSLKRLRERDKRLAEQRAKEQAHLDSLALADSLMIADSLAKSDSLAAPETLPEKMDSLAVKDSLSIGTDSLAIKDSLSAETLPLDAKAARKAALAEKKAKKKAEREAEKKRKQEALEAKWAEKDRRDAEKAAAKAAKRLEKERKRKRKALEEAAVRAEKEMKLFEKYKDKYREQKADEAAKSRRKSK